MKRSLTLILISSMIAVILCGCSSSDKEKSSSPESGASGTSQTSGESSAEKSQEDGSGELSEAEESKGKQYMDTLQIMVDVSDKAISGSETKPDEKKGYFLKTYDEFRKFYNDHKKEFSLEAVDSGSGFKEATKDLEKSFFDIYSAMITLQPYDKTQEIEIGDSYIENKSLTMDIYKEQPRAPDKTGYKLLLICLKKDQCGSLTPKLNILPLSEHYSDESDDGVSVELIHEDSDSPSDNADGKDN